MKLGDLAGGDAIVPQGAESIAISGITADSRKVGPGFLFAALSGSRADGMQYAADAASRGAAAILGPKGAAEHNAKTINVPVIEAAEPRAALARMAARFHPRQPGTMVAVTGTAGKTSVASFTRQIWEMEGRNAASIGTTGVSAPGREEYGSLTTPDPVDLHRLLDELAGEGVTHAAMEASSHGLDQRRLLGVRHAAAHPRARARGGRWPEPGPWRRVVHRYPGVPAPAGRLSSAAAPPGPEGGAQRPGGGSCSGPPPGRAD